MKLTNTNGSIGLTCFHLNENSQASSQICNAELLRFWILFIFFGGYREGEIPDPIPNSEVKTLVADGTMRKSMGE